MGLRRHWRRIALVLGFGIVVVMTLAEGFTTCVVSSQVGGAEITLSPVAYLTWPVKGARILEKGRPPRRAADYLHLTPGDRLTISRQGTGPIELSVRAPEGVSTAGTLVNASFAPVGQLGTEAIFVIGSSQRDATDGQTISFLFDNAVENLEMLLPTTVDDPVAPTSGGRVSLLHRSVFGGPAFEVVAFDLLPGDGIDLQGVKSPIVGFIVADDRPGLHVVYRAIMSHAKVTRLGGGGFEIRATLLDLVREDPTIQKVWAAYLFLTLCLAASARKGEGRRADETVPGHEVATSSSAVDP